MSTTCEEHCLELDDHCTEMERMLEHVPGEFCEGEGDSPADAVKRLAAAYEELREEVEDLRDAATLEGFIFRRIKNGRLRISAGDEREIVQHVTRRCTANVTKRKERRTCPF